MAIEAVQCGSLLTAALLMIIGLVALVYLDNVLKKIIGAAFIGDGVNLLIIALGYRVNGIPYIFLQIVHFRLNLWYTCRRKFGGTYLWKVIAINY